MEYADMTIAKVAGGVFVDKLLAIDMDTTRHQLAEEMLSRLKEYLRGSGQVIRLETTIGTNEFKIARGEDTHRRQFEVSSEGIQFSAATVKEFPTRFAEEFAECLGVLLQAAKRPIWNQIGTMFAIGIRSKEEAEEGSAAVDLLRQRVLASQMGSMEALIADKDPCEQQDTRIDLTVKCARDGRELTFNVYNTTEQDIALTLDVKSSEADALKGDILAFLLEAHDLFSQLCGPYAEELVQDPTFGPTVDLHYLRTGKR